MLEKTDGTIKNGQSRDIDNVGHTIHMTHDEDKQNKQKNHHKKLKR
jgi:nitrogen fixation-related uncharacterized protein